MNVANQRSNHPKLQKYPFKINECMRNENDREYMKLGMYTQGADIR